MAFRTIIDGIGAITETAPGGPFTTTGGIAADVIGSAADIILNNSVVAEGFAATASGADNEVDIAAGRCYVYNSAYTTGGTEQKYWPVSNDATTAVVIPANVSGNPRIDLICVAVDPLQTPGDDGAANCFYDVVQGTPAATPVAPSVPADYCVITQVNVANGFTTISNGDLTDRRQMYSPISGWTPLPILPTYSSASGVQTTLSYSGASSIFSKGDRLYVTQGGSSKFFSVISVSGSTLVVTGGTDYTFSNSAVQTAYISRGGSTYPAFPAFFNYTPTVTAISSMTISALTVSVARFAVIGDSVRADIHVKYTTGGTASASIRITLPISTAESVTDAVRDVCFGTNSGIEYFLVSFLAATPNTLEIRREAGANYSLGAGRSIGFSGFSYLI